MPESIMREFGRRLRALREDRGWSQEELAARAGLHRTYVGSVERGERNISLVNIGRIAAALGLRPHSLLEAGAALTGEPTAQLLVSEHVNANAVLPYGLTVSNVCSAMSAAYDLLHGVNSFLVGEGVEPLERLLLGNSFSGLLSEVLVKYLARESAGLARNEKVGGHPDLIPTHLYEPGGILRAPEGIEIKTSRQPGGWQGHNPEKCWLMVFRYVMPETIHSTEAAIRVRFAQVLCAELCEEDWSFSGRSGGSRRTITASITETGMHKLRSNPVYEDPDFIVAPNKRLRRLYEELHGSFARRDTQS